MVARLRRAGAVVVAKTRPWGAGPRVAPPARSGALRRRIEQRRGGRRRRPAHHRSGSGATLAAASASRPRGAASSASSRRPGSCRRRATSRGSGALSDGRTQIGPLARTVDDLERVLAVIAGPDWRDGGVVPVPVRSSASVDLSGARVAVVGGAGIAHPEVTDAVERAAAVFEAAGATRVAWIDSWLDDGLDVTERYWDRTGLTGAEAARQLWDWDRYRRRYLQAAEHVDLVLAPPPRRRHRSTGRSAGRTSCSPCRPA